MVTQQSPQMQDSREDSAERLDPNRENALQDISRHQTVLAGADTSEEIMLNSTEADPTGDLETKLETRIGTSTSNNSGLG